MGLGPSELRAESFLDHLPWRQTPTAAEKEDHFVSLMPTRSVQPASLLVRFWDRSELYLQQIPFLLRLPLFWSFGDENHPRVFLRPRILPPDTRADFILVEKRARRLILFEKGKALKGYDIALGRVPVGPKEQEGDRKTPEGHYHINWRNPNSKYHLSLNISYPTREQKAAAQAQGRSAGRDIMIHGQPNGAHSWVGAEGTLPGDWTDGCIAVSNAEIEEIWRSVPNGTPIEIRP